ncbi:MAG: DUF4160 domain-containing protein [Planctomycetota bacterium]|nr:DUF4160 domain-containing protein [Planctomycetota bacterium]
MPTVLRIRGFRFFFFSNEGREPPHIHVESGDSYAKFWLAPVELAASIGYNPAQLAKLRRLIEAHQRPLMESWHDYFS